MDKPILSKEFTLEDIRKIRDYNSSIHLKMTKEEQIIESENTMSWFREEMEKRAGEKLGLV